MANLEKKILDGENVGYCSSSDEELSNDYKVDTTEDPSASRYSLPSKGENTGPKGVLADYKLYQEELQRKRQKDQKKVVFMLIKKILICLFKIICSY